jgi:hypothetical protein
MSYYISGTRLNVRYYPTCFYVVVRSLRSMTRDVLFIRKGYTCSITQQAGGGCTLLVQCVVNDSIINTPVCVRTFPVIGKTLVGNSTIKHRYNHNGNSMYINVSTDTTYNKW